MKRFSFVFGAVLLLGQSLFAALPSVVDLIVTPLRPAVCISSNALVSPNPSSNPGAGGEYRTNASVEITLTHDGTARWATNGDASPTWNIYSAPVTISYATTPGTNSWLFRYAGSNANCALSAVASNLYTLTNTPPSLPVSQQGLVWWFTAAGTNINAGSPNDGDQVTLWSDSSGAGRNLSRSSGTANCVWKSTEGTNSRPCVRFINEGGWLTNRVNMPGVFTNAQIWLVMRPLPGVVDYSPFLNLNDDTAAYNQDPYGFCAWYLGNFMASFPVSSGDSGIQYDTAGNTNEWMVFHVNVKGWQSLEVFTNNVSAGSDTLAGRTMTPVTQLTLGHDYYTGAFQNAWNPQFDISEVIIYTNLLTGAEFTKTTNYISTNYHLYFQQ